MARIQLSDLKSHRRPFEPVDPSRDTFDERFRPIDPLRDYLNRDKGTPVRPGYQERFLDPSKVISQGGLPPSVNAPPPRTAPPLASQAVPVGAPVGPAGAPTLSQMLLKLYGGSNG